MPVWNLRAAVARIWNERMKLGPLLVALLVAGAAYFVMAQLATDTKSLEISSLITQVRCELNKAETDMRRRGELGILKLEDFDLEINFVVKKSGSLQATVAGMGGGLGGDSERVQKLHLHWKGKSELETYDIAVSDPQTVSVEKLNAQPEEPCQIASGT